MYCREIINDRIALAEKHLGFQLEYHTPSEIDDFNQRLEERHKDAYVLAQRASQGVRDSQSPFQNTLIKALADIHNPKLSSDEIRWIKNERALSMCDASYFLNSYYWIKSDRGIMRIALEPAQQIYMSVIAEMEAMGRPAESIVCKARQLGISTVTEGLILHRILFGYGVNAIAASADDTKTPRMAQMIFMGYDYLPWWLGPQSTRRVESQAGMLYFGGIRSGVSFQHGGQSIGRGDTTSAYHLSEVASFPNAKQSIEASLFPSVHQHSNVFGVLESTAEGDSGWFYDTYWYSKSEWANQRARLYPLFLPWYLGTNKYPVPNWIKTRPVPQDWKPEEDTLSMMVRAKKYIESSPLLEKVLGTNWECPREQAWFWECNFIEKRAKGIEKLWYQEMPSSDKEAFQSSYDNVFGRETIAEVNTKRDKAYHVYGIVGQSIEDRFEPEDEERDYEEPTLEVCYIDRIKDLGYKWELQPLLWKEPFRALEDIRSDSDEHMGKFFVYLEPERGYDYSIGIRTGNGIGSGDTVVAVARRGLEPTDPDIQAAEFRSSEVSHVEAYAYALAIAAYYSRYMGHRDNDGYDYGIAKKEPYVAIEQVQSVGDTCQLQMRKMGYRRFHRMTRYDSDPKNMRKSKASKIGWYSFGWSTPMYVDSFVVWIRNGWYKVNSPYTIHEMDHWERHTTEAGKEKFIASPDTTDAGLLANAMAAFCVNDMAPMAERTLKQRFDLRLHRKMKLDMTPTPLGTVFPLTGYNSKHGLDRLTR